MLMGVETKTFIKRRRGCERQSENFQQMTRRDPDMLFQGAASALMVKIPLWPQFQL